MNYSPRNPPLMTKLSLRNALIVLVIVSLIGYSVYQMITMNNNIYPS
jgi:hypothetical protein